MREKTFIEIHKVKEVQVPSFNLKEELTAVDLAFEQTQLYEITKKKFDLLLNESNQRLDTCVQNYNHFCDRQKIKDDL